MKKLLLICVAIALLAGCAFAESMEINYVTSGGNISQTMDDTTGTITFTFNDNDAGLYTMSILNFNSDWILGTSAKSISFSIDGYADDYHSPDGYAMAVHVSSERSANYYSLAAAGNGDYFVDLSALAPSFVYNGGLTEGDIINMVSIMPSYNFDTNDLRTLTKSDLKGDIYTISNFSTQATVPEPSSALGLLTACSCLAIYRLRRKARK